MYDYMCNTSDSHVKNAQMGRLLTSFISKEI